MLVLVMIAAMFSGCAGKKSAPLRICVDLGLTHAGASSVSSAVYDLIAPLESSGKIPNIEVEYIPREGSERESALKRLRVELMSGEGPDVFIMECVAGTHLYGGDALFPMPEKAMEAGIFLPLDDYIENCSEYADWDQFTQVVLDAGKNEEGQQIIPIVYTLPGVSYAQSAFTYTPSCSRTWQDMMNDEVQRDAAALLAGGVTEYGLCDFRLEFALGRIADYTEDELLFTEEELLQRATQLMELSRYAEDNVLDETTGMFEGYLGKGFNDSWVETNGLTQEDELTILPMYSDDGGCSAMILSYAAVNRNSKRPEEAFKVIDRLMSKSMMQSSPLYEDYFYWSAFGMPVDEEVLSSAYPLKLNAWCYSDENNAAIDTVRAQITNAEFGGALHAELEQLMLNCYNAEQAGGSVEKIVHDAYEKMKLMIAE